MTTIDDVSTLESTVGKRPAGSHLKSISFLDDHALALLARSSLTVVGTTATDGDTRTRTIGGPAGHCTADGPKVLALPGLDTADLSDGAPVGALSLVPGYGETLRVNGVLRLDPAPRIEVAEVFLHCAKAVIRSELWHPAEGRADDTTAVGLDHPAVRAFLSASRFVALSSSDDRGEADVSPKGDPAGFCLALDDRRVAIPDRPGNRRTDTLHNLMTRPDLGVLVFVAGDDRTLELRGRATVTSDPDVLGRMAVNGRTPKAAVVLDVDHAALAPDAGVAAASLWDTSRQVGSDELPRACRIWTDHVKLNDDPGLAAATARKLANEKLLTKGIDRDYRENLY